MPQRFSHLWLFGLLILAPSTSLGANVARLQGRSLVELSVTDVGDLLKAAAVKAQSGSLEASERHAWAESARETLIAGGVDGETLQELFLHTGEEARHRIIVRLMPNASVGDQVRLLKWLRKIYEGAESHELRVAAAHSLWQPRRALQAGPPADATFEQRWSLLHDALLDGYNFNVPPANCKIEVSINFFKFYALDQKASTLAFSAWFRSGWTDSRLSWDEKLWQVPYITLQAEPRSLENTLVWLPDLELYNNEESIDKSFQTKPIQVYSNGNVLFSRPGIMKALCKYTGLFNFPFDILTCKLEIGAWSLDGSVQDIVARESDGGFTWEGDGENGGATAGATFQDYNIVGISVERVELFYPLYPQPFPELIYTVSLKRSIKFYETKLLTPQISMAFLSFIPYFMSPGCGERLGFGITLILAILTTDVISIDLMPVCQEKLLLDYITQVSFAFCMISLLESGLVLFIFYLKVESALDMLPMWIQKVFRKKGQHMQSLEKGFASGVAIVQTDQAEADVLKDTALEAMTAVTPCADKNTVAPVSGPVESMESLPGSVKETDAGACKMHPRLSAPLGGPSRAKTFMNAEVNEEVNGSDEVDLRKLSLRVRNGLYRQAFYTLDENYSGRLELEEISNFGHFMLGSDWTDDLTRRFMEEFDEDHSGSMSLNEFAEFCEKILLDPVSKDLEYLNQMVLGFLHMMHRRQEQTTAKWHHYANLVDRWFRWIVPPMYIIIVLVVLNLDFEKLAAGPKE